jgi:hypothetical protein
MRVDERYIVLRGGSGKGKRRKISERYMPPPPLLSFASHCWIKQIKLFSFLFSHRSLSLSPSLFLILTLSFSHFYSLFIFLAHSFCLSAVFFFVHDNDRFSPFADTYRYINFMCIYMYKRVYFCAVVLRRGRWLSE